MKLSSFKSLKDILHNQAQNALEAENSIIGSYYVDITKVVPHAVQRPIDEEHAIKLGAEFMKNPNLRDNHQNYIFVVSPVCFTKEDIERNLVKKKYLGREMMVFDLEAFCIAGGHRIQAARYHMGGVTFHTFWVAKFYKPDLKLVVLK